MPIRALTTSDFRPKRLTELKRAFGNKVSLTSEQFDTLAREQRARAFRLLAVNKVTLIQRVQNEIGQALERGTSFRDLQNKIQQLFTEAGIESPSGHYLRLAMRQNMMTTYNVAKQRTGLRPAIKAAFPYWMYITAGDANVRPEHAALNGKVFAKGDPFWDRFFPPWEWNCRCTVRNVSKREAKRLGVAVIEDGEKFARKEGVAPHPTFDFPRDQLFDKASLAGIDKVLRKLVEERIKDAEEQIIDHT